MRCISPKNWWTDWSMPNVIQSVACKTDCLPTHDDRLFTKFYYTAHAWRSLQAGSKVTARNATRMCRGYCRRSNNLCACASLALWHLTSPISALRGIIQFCKLLAILNRETTLLRGNVNIALLIRPWMWSANIFIEYGILLLWSLIPLV